MSRASARDGDWARDRGSATAETALVMPILVMFLLLVVLTGRLTDARSDIVGAANDGARAGSVQDTAGAAASQAQQAAIASVEGERIECEGGPQVDADVINGADGSLRGGLVHVTVTCVVPVGDLALIDVGATTIEGEAWESIDQHASE